MRALLTRRWFVAHVAVVAAVTTCVLAGRWQLRRLEERREYNRVLLGRAAAPPLAETELAPGSPAGNLAFRRATVEGTFDGDRQVLLTGRVLEGRTGSHVLTPLRTEAGFAVLVDRGWVAQQVFDEASPPPQAPAGGVRVTGILLPSDERGRFGPRIPPASTLRAIPRLDVSRVAKQVPYPMAPLALRLSAQEPAPVEGQPVPAPLPPPGEGPHLPYAIQWFAFATVFLAGYSVIVRRALKGRATGEMPVGG